MSAPRVAIVGAPLELAADLVTLLLDRGIAPDHVRILDREDTAGETVELEDFRRRVEWAAGESVAGADFAIFCGRAEIARELTPALRARGGVAIDATSCARSEPGVPIVVPEVNGPALGAVGPGSVIASPSAAAVGLALALAPLHRAARVRRVTATVFEPAAQRGPDAIDELSRQSIQLMQGRGLDRDEFHEQLAFNVRAQRPEEEGGWSPDELALARELPIVLDAADLTVAATVVRAPVFFGSAQSVSVELEREVQLADAETALRAAPGVLLAGSVEDRLAVAVEAARRRKERAAAAHEEEDDDRDIAEEMREDGLEEIAEDEDDEDEGEGRERRRDDDEPQQPEDRAPHPRGADGDPEPDLVPGPVDVSGSAFVHVARLRVDAVHPRSLLLWIAFDELRRGVAMNAVGILELALQARG
ncbi:MAG TPA: Asd/ArgC dimerization domain-containing protein [Candidatus Binatia bacterium]|nr:Asd/ArgC dimerization domain-containing protein [Candidatus Binatia bacterium]